MAKINDHYQKLTAGYLFPEIARRVAAFTETNPEADVIKLGIGDVTRPLPPAVIDAFHAGVDEMASADTFRGYGPEQGHLFLRELIATPELTRLYEVFRSIGVNPNDRMLASDEMDAEL